MLKEPTEGFPLERTTSHTDFPALSREALVNTDIHHNVGILRTIHGGLEIALRDEIQFDMRKDYWFRPERRFLVAYLARTFRKWPAENLEQEFAKFVVSLSRQVEGLRVQPIDNLTDYRIDYPGAIADILQPVRGLADHIETPANWKKMQSRRDPAPSAAQSLALLCESIQRDGFAEHDASLGSKFRWFAVIGTKSIEELERRQGFFVAYQSAVMSHNSYRRAGSQFFGPIVGNTPVQKFLYTLSKWRDGESIVDAPLVGLDRTALEPTNFSDNNVAGELWGFFNLHKQPFYNSKAAAYLSGSSDPIEAVRGIGKKTRTWISKNEPAAVQLARRFDELIEDPGVQSTFRAYVARRWDGQDGSDVDRSAHHAIHASGAKRLRQLSRDDKAAILLHLQMDVLVYAESDSVEPGGQGTEPESTPLLRARRVWLYAPGRAASHWDNDRSEGTATIGWGEVGDLSRFSTVKELQAELRDVLDQTAEPASGARMCWNFAHEMRRGDMILARRGRSEIIGIGVVDGDYRFTEGEYGNKRPVKWTWSGSHMIKSKKSLPVATLTDATRRHALLRELSQLDAMDSKVSEEEPIYEIFTYTREDALADLFIADHVVDEMHQLLLRRHNLILQGPPGVGKTFVAKRLAFRLLGARDESRVRTVQFHQAYTYEHFVRGYRPDDQGHFQLANGPLYDLAELAKADADNAYVLIIDEINRGNLSRILGEAMLLLESDKRSEDWAVQLAYSRDETDEDERFYLPPNLYIIGTMNTADRSLAMVDYALRRRFAFMDLEPGFELNRFAEHLGELRADVRDRLLLTMRRLNETIRSDPNLGSGFQIGHSYFCSSGDGAVPWADDPEGWIRTIYRFELMPLLREYWVDDKQRLAEAQQLLGLVQ